MGTYARSPVEFTSGLGTRLWDDQGNEYLDFLAGISVVQIGHCHPKLVETITEQTEQLMHVGNLFYTAPGISLAERLAERSLGGKAFLCNSGAEAVECAIKLARRRRAGGEFVVMEGGFHGRTMGALSATPQEAKQAPFAPLVPGFRAVPRNAPTALAEAVNERTAAVIIEPIQGEGGIHPVDHDTLVAAREACDAHGALLIFDEIQSGMGRTGDLWAWQGAGVEPDVITVAKGLGGGLPIGACVTRPAYADVFQLGDHGSTFAGGPVVASAAHTVLDVIDDATFLDDVKVKGSRLEGKLSAIGLRVRGRGLMLGFEVPDAPRVARRLLEEQRVVVNATGPDTIRLLPPLTVTEDEIDEAVESIAEVIETDRPGSRASTLPLRRYSDAELLLLAPDDPAAFEIFYERHSQPILHYLNRHTRDLDLAMDLQAEVFTQALAGMRKYQPERGAARGWLFGIAKIVLLSSYRRQSAESSARRKLGNLQIGIADDSIEEAEDLIDALATGLVQGLEELPSAERAAVTARVIEERDYAEIAQALQMPETVIRQRVKRGLARLAKRSTTGSR